MHFVRQAFSLSSCLQLLQFSVLTAHQYQKILPRRKRRHRDQHVSHKIVTCHESCCPTTASCSQVQGGPKHSSRVTTTTNQLLVIPHARGHYYSLMVTQKPPYDRPPPQQHIATCCLIYGHRPKDPSVSLQASF
ncbi:hypothetical protein M441DRAFT_260136 [Trichoderma asperellum CBS 433.97]|uniref:Secreted protein n=1 Tax=Trichoderma asperellum (strain ATCC 204424 / CBS 433.97 / NBRC 101777) TaxID=1042311 RepID=A0A2T3YZA6_TRIA4|nr:hypothetical protein M441DRAFT_260136 [Trichoderma asperellum CBS 433.97]PTB37899.1 hypothetical protein M441DRAFT_260136 [Trichoderma asperellum CBS 433.97]